jgi:hypothetical protein
VSFSRSNTNDFLLSYCSKSSGVEPEPHHFAGAGAANEIVWPEIIGPMIVSKSVLHYFSFAAQEPRQHLTALKHYLLRSS